LKPDKVFRSILRETQYIARLDISPSHLLHDLIMQNCTEEADVSCQKRTISPPPLDPGLIRRSRPSFSTNFVLTLALQRQAKSCLGCSSIFCGGLRKVSTVGHRLTPLSFKLLGVGFCWMSGASSFGGSLPLLPSPSTNKKENQTKKFRRNRRRNKSKKKIKAH
jgi:hypothetical protein